MTALSPRSGVLLTGVTGLLGGEILRELVKRHPGEISTLIRRSNFQSPQIRFAERMARSGEYGDYFSHRVMVIEGDISLSHWGLSPADSRHVTDHIDTIIHCAADTSFIRGESVIDTNIQGTRNLIALAKSNASFARNILWFAPLLYEFDALPIDPTSEIDLISTTFMAQSTVELMLTDGLEHDCYHVSAGHHHGVTRREVLETFNRFYGRRPPQLIPPEQWTIAEHRQFVRRPEQRKVFHALRYYLPFLNMDVTYDDSRLRQALGAHMPEFQEFNSYSDHLLSQIGMNEALAEAARP